MYAKRTFTFKQLKEFCGRHSNSFHIIESTLRCIQHCGKYNLNFPLCGNCNVDFPLCRKNGLRFSAKLEVKYFMFYNVQGEYRYSAVIALKWFATEMLDIMQSPPNSPLKIF